MYTVDGTVLETLAELVEQPPGDYGYLRSTWTSEMLAETLAGLLSRPVHASTVRRWLVKLGFGWRRARPTLHLRDPRAAERLFRPALRPSARPPAAPASGGSSLPAPCGTAVVEPEISLEYRIVTRLDPSRTGCVTLL